MKAVRIHTFGGPDVLQIEDVDVPSPREHEVLLRVHASSVNPVDYKIRKGEYPPVQADKLPITLGRDVAAFVERIGPGVSAVAEGQKIYTLLDRDRGGYAEYVIARAEICAPVPSSIDFVTSGAVPLAALTAWQGLFDQGNLQSGQAVLIHGASGGVGHLAVQFAKAKGARVIANTGKDSLEVVRSLGADRVLDYSRQRFEDLVKDVDVVFDLVGGETQRRSWSVLKKGGILVSTVGQPDTNERHRSDIQVKGYMTKPSREQLLEIARLIDAGQVKVVIAREFPLEDIRNAHRFAEHEHPVGKVVLRISD